MRRVLTAVLVVSPLVIALVIAGSTSDPDDVRPCLAEYDEGITGGPTHLILGPGGDLYANEEAEERILRFNPDTHEAREYEMGVPVHDLIEGPDGRVWFVSYQTNEAIESGDADYLGALDVDTGEITFYPGISPDAEPHMLRWNRDGRLYITEQNSGQLAIFDPKTERIEEGAFGLPPGNYIHNIVVLPNGDLWAVLQEGDALARFNFAKQRFDKFVEIPIEDSGARDITYVESRNALFATLFAANKLVEYDLDTGELTLHDTHLEPITYEDAQSRAPLPKLTFVRPDANEDAVWVSTLAGGELLRYDLASGETARVGCGVTVPAGPLGLASDEQGRLWVAQPFPGQIAEVLR